MKINENTELTYQVVDENNNVLGTFNTRKEANKFIYKLDDKGANTLLWTVVPQQIEKSYFLTNNGCGDDDFTLEIKTLKDLIEGLKQAKALGENHIHLEVLGRINNAPYNNSICNEVIIPLTKEYFGSIYTIGI